MTDKKIRKAAKRSILNGKTKQETFEELKGKSYKSAKKAANIIQTIPSLQARRKYKIEYITLIVFLSATILIIMKAVIPFIIEKGVWLLMIFLLPPLINLLVGVITYNPNSYIWVTLLSFPWQAYLGNALVGDTFEPILLLYLIIATGV